MTEPNQNPATPPADAGQGAGGAPQPGAQPPAAAANNGQPSGGVNPDGQQPNLSIEDINALKRKAGRWDALQTRNRQDRRANRGNRSNPNYNADDTPPELLDALRDRDDKINELSSVKVKLEVKDKVRDLLETDDYKDLPQGIRRAIVRNPLGFASESAQSVEEALADIQDYLDDELDRIASVPANSGGQQPTGGQPPAPGQQPAAPAGGNNIPPASGSGPSNPAVDVNQGTEGLSGSKRSTLVLQNILKKK